MKLTPRVAADTVVLTHPSPGLSQTPFEHAPMDRQEVLEKPSSKEDNLRMLLDMNGGVCEVVTGVTVGASICAQLYVPGGTNTRRYTQCIPS